ncbi:undecaprenyldiphospho-muramoylpentapeptide beta-N-acetylglucosaminyltransferase [Flexibacterium corallicola]|uniref:undecaprenyldiphospho-muramoylpentapeptide beta-N-acetylglucosaminyltransferase n=1 Tax=Flexibacterium corallicola TaxID=3037259 RepID=UPI00286F8692|nr:undecaprenyldiphospho-muramoylpentapeptide beta-N-acetylglucosaminyltransferase [Pseudovibrio sp. M1P-2-3]
MKPKILLTAGGTGGHLFPAQALAQELGRRGYAVELLTDERADKYGSAFPAEKVHLIESETIRGRNPLNLAKTLFKLLKGTLQAYKIIRSSNATVIIGFGGYPTFPPMFAARLARLPSILHEANSVMGRANRMLAKGVSALATTFELKQLEPALKAKAVTTGNPLRDNVLAVSNVAYHTPEVGGSFHLLVTGGSQGARFFSQVMPQTLGLLTSEERSRLAIVQQCRPEDLERVEATYRELGIAAQLAPFFKDLPAHISAAHLVLSRAGATTVCELAAIGRPSILVPLPGAIDNDQGNNAKVLEEAGGAWSIAQKDLSPQRLAEELRRLMGSPETLSAAAQAAKTKGQPDAVSRLADLVEDVAAMPPHRTQGD